MRLSMPDLEKPETKRPVVKRPTLVEPEKTVQAVVIPGLPLSAVTVQTSSGNHHATIDPVAGTLYLPGNELTKGLAENSTTRNVRSALEIEGVALVERVKMTPRTSPEFNQVAVARISKRLNRLGGIDDADRAVLTAMMAEVLPSLEIDAKGKALTLARIAVCGQEFSSLEERKNAIIGLAVYYGNHYLRAFEQTVIEMAEVILKVTERADPGAYNRMRAAARNALVDGGNAVSAVRDNINTEDNASEFAMSKLLQWCATKAVTKCRLDGEDHNLWTVARPSMVRQEAQETMDRYLTGINRALKSQVADMVSTGNKLAAGLRKSMKQMSGWMGLMSKADGPNCATTAFIEQVSGELKVV